MTPPVSRLDALDPRQRESLDLFARMLIEGNRFVNLTSIVDPEAIRIRHFEDSLAALELLDRMVADKETGAERGTDGGGEDRPFRLIDVGSGAGFPGLALAVARPDWLVASLESTGKKIAFQRSVVEALGLENVRLLQGRAENLGHDPAHREAYDAVLSRALAPLDVLLELTLPFARVGGRVVAWKTSRVEDEMTGIDRALGALGGGPIESAPYVLPASREGESAAGALRLVVVPKIALTPVTYPRKPKAIAKRSLGSAQGNPLP